jgi:hypothetical protein
LRVPYTFNSKYLGELGLDPEVKIIQQWDSSQSLPEIDNLLVEFQTLLVDRKLKAEINDQKKISRANNPTNTIRYVEKLLSIQIKDHRKFAISLILAPYFVNIQNLSDAYSFSKIKQWAFKCNESKRLEPSIEYFDELIKSAIGRVKNTQVKPLKFSKTLRYKNRELYDVLQ